MFCRKVLCYSKEILKKNSFDYEFYVQFIKMLSFVYTMRRQKYNPSSNFHRQILYVKKGLGQE